VTAGSVARMSEHPPFDSAKYRQVLGHFATGVTVITAAPDGEPVGLAVGSFSSVSLDPPLVAFFAGKGSASWPKIEVAGAFCVNILAEDQEEVSRRFASKDEDKFGGLGWTSAASGSPLLDGALAWVDCDIESVVEAGDHYCVMGRIRDLGIGHDGAPLIFFRGGYGRFTV
jgi:3-hydroxy-9,10-secoandrosta-1,3,5(10)-triene-9,17-dione monooxygenase reductase component